MIFLIWIKSFTLTFLLLFYLNNSVCANITNINEAEDKDNENKDRTSEKIITKKEEDNDSDIKNKEEFNKNYFDRFKEYTIESKNVANKNNEKKYKIIKHDKNGNDITYNSHSSPNYSFYNENFMNSLNTYKNKELARNVKVEKNSIYNKIIKFFIFTLNKEFDDQIIRGEDETNNEDKSDNFEFVKALIKNVISTDEDENKKEIEDIIENEEDLEAIASATENNIQKEINNDYSEKIKKTLLKRNQDIKNATNAIDDGIYKFEQIFLKMKFYALAIHDYIKFKSNHVCEYSKCGRNARCYIVQKDKEECRCNANYIQDERLEYFSCIPMNDKNCSVNNGFCDKNAYCSIVNNNIKCHCKIGFFGDGIFCVNHQIKNSIYILLLFIIFIFQKFFL